MNMTPSWIGLIILFFIGMMLVKGLANPGTRPWVIGMGVVGLGMCFVAFFSFRAVRVEQSAAQWQRQQAQAVVRQAETWATTPIAPSPPKTSAAPAKQPKTGLVDALAAALGKAWNDHATPAKKPAKPVKKEAVLPAEREEIRPLPQPPAWVNAAPRLQGDVYLMSLHVGPYTTPLECERDLPKVLQTALAEYADLLLGQEQARTVRLPDQVLEDLICERWTEHLTKEFGGVAQDMVNLHVLIGFDPAMQDRIRAAAEHAVVTRRIQSTGAVVGGVLGLLALVWGGLRLVGDPRGEERTSRTATTARTKNSVVPVILVVGVLGVLAVLAVLFLA
jgi:hypothetical protein